jgi:peptide deformylase
VEEISIDDGIRISEKLNDVLIKYRKEVGYGRGFAAPQIGENKAVFVTFVDDKLETFINPKIVDKSKETNFYRELCLSSGIMSADVERSEWIVMEWLDVDGKKHKEKFDGFLARLYQHEEAHLRGKLNIDEVYEGGIEFALFDPLKEQIRKSR